MIRPSIVASAVLGLALLAPSRPSAQAGNSSHDGQSFTAATTAILVDVVVRDRKGHPVTDLTGADFEVAEDGVPQKVDTFARVARGGGIGVGVGWKSPDTTVAVTPTGSAASSASEPEPPADAATALVFDHLSSDTLKLAQDATLAYVPMNGESAVRVAVFATDPGIRIVQPFTTDRSLVRKAVARVVPSGTSTEEQKAERAEDLMNRRRELHGEVEGAVGAAAGGSSAALAQNASELGERETELQLI